MRNKSLSEVLSKIAPARDRGSRTQSGAGLLLSHASAAAERIRRVASRSMKANAPPNEVRLSCCPVQAATSSKKYSANLEWPRSWRSAGVPGGPPLSERGDLERRVLRGASPSHG